LRASAAMAKPRLRGAAAAAVNMPRLVIKGMHSEYQRSGEPREPADRRLYFPCAWLSANPWAVISTNSACACNSEMLLAPP